MSIHDFCRGVVRDTAIGDKTARDLHREDTDALRRSFPVFGTAQKLVDDHRNNNHVGVVDTAITKGWF